MNNYKTPNLWLLTNYIHFFMQYHKRSNEYKARGTLIDRVMIEARPKIVEKKSRIGDLEIDTVYRQKSHWRIGYSR